MGILNDKVYEFVKNIPRGKVATYGQIALFFGNRNFARAVGNILHSNPDPEHITCSYAFDGIVAPGCRFPSEGVVFKNEQVVDLSISHVIW